MFAYQPRVAAVVPSFVSHFNSVVVEAGWLQHVAYSKHIGPTFMDLFSYALGPTAIFNSWGGEYLVLYRIYKSYNQLILPIRGEFHAIVLWELHDKA